MALFQPTNITPSSFSGPAAGTVDVTKNLTVSWQVNGNSPMTAYQIIIMQNDTASTQVLDTGKTTLLSPFYGTNYKGETQYFSCVITASSMSTAGMTNGYSNGYKMQITQYWTEGGSEKNIVQTSASFFITRSTPTLTVAAFPSTINNKSYTFSATFSQAEGDTVEWMRWVIQAQTASGYTNILDTGKIYGSGEIKVDYDGFFSGNSYRIMCTVQSENGIEISSGWGMFTVSYAVSVMEGATDACPLGHTDAIEVTFPDNAYIPGVATGNYTYTTNIFGSKNISLATSGDSVTWNEMNGVGMSLSAPFTLVITGILNNGSSLNQILTATVAGKMLSVSQDGSYFYIKYDGNTLFNISVNTYGGEYYILVLSESAWWFTIYEYTQIPLLPSDTLYPSSTLYPSDGIKTSSSQNGLITSTWQNGDISSITVFGPNEFDYVWVIRGMIDSSVLNTLMSDASYEPTYTDDTQFLALFNNTLAAGSLVVDGAINGYSVYRQENNASVFEHVMDFPLSTKKFRDYGAASQNTYQYYVYAFTDTVYAASSIVSALITPLFWNYTLLCCSMDNNGVYHVENEYRFALDVASGVVSNNNKPAIQDNFTPYPLRQPMNSNYRSGTLSAYIGKAANNEYQDSLSLMQELRAVSTSSLTKFLKTRKGELMQVETSAPITMQIVDQYTKQPVKISVPWVEVADASNAQIVSEQTDVFWNTVDSESAAEAIACMPSSGKDILANQLANLNQRVSALENTDYEGTWIGPNTPTDNSNLWVDTDE